MLVLPRSLSILSISRRSIPRTSVNLFGPFSRGCHHHRKPHAEDLLRANNLIQHTKDDIIKEIHTTLKKEFETKLDRETTKLHFFETKLNRETTMLQFLCTLNSLSIILICMSR